MNPLILAGYRLLVPAISTPQESGFVGSWLLWVESGNQGVPAYGSLVFEEAGDTLAVYVEGGPANLLELDGNHVTFEFDWSDFLDLVHVSVMEGTLENGIIHGTASGDEGDRGVWRATQVVQGDALQLPTDPSDVAGIWSRPAIISKHSFDLTEAGRVADDAYDPTIDDPILRCVSDGLIRMSHGPFHIEVIEGQDRFYVLHEDLHEVRRIFLDGRDFPEGVKDAILAMGYSIGHWEGATFVIETRGLKQTVWDAGGMPVSSGAVVTERWYLDDPGQLHIEISMQDPVNYNRPVLMHLIRTREPDNADVGEYSCDPHGFYRGLQVEGRLEEYWGRSRNRL